MMNVFPNQKQKMIQMHMMMANLGNLSDSGQWTKTGSTGSEQGQTYRFFQTYN